MIQNFIKGIVFGGVVAGIGLGVVSELAPRAEPAQTLAIAPGPTEPVELPAKPDPVTVPLPETATEPQTAPETAVVQPVNPKPAAPVLAPEPPEVATEVPVAPQVQIAGKAPEVQPFAESEPLPAAPEALPKAPEGDALPVADASLAAPLPEAAPPEPVVITPEPPTESLLTPAPDVAEPAPAQIVMDPPLTAEKPKVLAPPSTTVLPPAQDLPKSVDGVKTGRLPSIGAAPAAPEVAPTPSVSLGIPLQDYARSFSNDTGKPLFVVVLQDDGAADLDRAALAALPFAVTFAIDPMDATAPDAEQIYRAAGQEVVALASGIPKGATASDLEQSFQANSAVLPEAVAVMDLGEGGFQDDRPLATLVVPLIAAQGRGLLTFDKGLNAANQVARRDGVPSATIFRALDTGSEEAPLIRRYLDRAAFKAAQEGRVVVLGSTRPEMIAALMEWAVEGRGASVALAPLSAALTK